MSETTLSDTTESVEVIQSSDNEELVKGLRMLANHLETHPEIPYLNCSISKYAYNKESFLEYAHTLGSFKKTFNDKYISLRANFTDRIEVNVFVSRENICKQVVSWECPEDMKSLLQGAIDTTEDN